MPVLKQLVKYQNGNVIEATWVDGDGEAEVVVRRHAYSNAQMDMLRSDLGTDAAEHEALIAEVEATYVPPAPPPLADRKAAAWEAIKAERDRRKYLGVKVGQHWFHSDDPSRIQQLALAMMGNAIPAGLQWKTLTLTPPPVFVDMTPALAQGIFMATSASDAAIFSAAEVHRMAMESSEAPELYDYSTGWPTSIEEEAHAAGFAVDARVL